MEVEISYSTVNMVQYMPLKSWPFAFLLFNNQIDSISLMGFMSAQSNALRLIEDTAVALTRTPWLV